MLTVFLQTAARAPVRAAGAVGAGVPVPHAAAAAVPVPERARTRRARRAALTTWRPAGDQTIYNTCSSRRLSSTYYLTSANHLCRH